jgi:hypothetical protein
VPKFIRCKCLFLNPTVNEVALHEMGISSEQSCVLDTCVFDLNEVTNWNPSSHGMTTVYLKNGHSMVVEFTMDSFTLIMQKQIGKIYDVELN